MLLQNKIGRSLGQGLRRNETGKIKTRNPPLYDQYFSLSKRMRFPAKLGNNMGWPKPIYMHVGYVFDLRFSERKIQPISIIFGILNK